VTPTLSVESRIPQFVSRTRAMATTTTIYNGTPITDLLTRNQAWAQSTNVYFPALFPKLATGQVPQIFWIGCCDSRVPETQLLGLLPGEIFVHRNIANLYNPSDISLPAALHYAVEEVKVSPASSFAQTLQLGGYRSKILRCLSYYYIHV